MIDHMPTSGTQSADGGHSRFITAPDGLRLHIRIWGKDRSGLPLVCLPGLTRTVDDFAPLATAVAGKHDGIGPVYGLDSRGRGRSDHDRNPDNYTVQTELADLIAALTALDIGKAVFLGSSRGGLLVMMLAVARPTVIAGAVLNDIGPMIGAAGLMRIKGYVGHLPRPRNHEEGAEILKRVFGGQFPALTAQDWRLWSGRAWRERDGHLTPTHDPRLAATLKAVRPDSQLPSLWREFDALAAAGPVLTIRGELSDILSSDTLAQMKARQPGTRYLIIKNEGHTPLLSDNTSISEIAAFVGACNAG